MSTPVERVGTRVVAEQLGVTPIYLRHLVKIEAIATPTDRSGRGRGGGFMWSPSEIKNAKGRLDKLTAKAKKADA